MQKEYKKIEELIEKEKVTGYDAFSCYVGEALGKLDYALRDGNRCRTQKFNDNVTVILRKYGPLYAERFVEGAYNFACRDNFTTFDIDEYADYALSAFRQMNRHVGSRFVQNCEAVDRFGVSTTEFLGLVGKAYQDGSPKHAAQFANSLPLYLCAGGKAEEFQRNATFLSSVGSVRLAGRFMHFASQIPEDELLTMGQAAGLANICILSVGEKCTYRVLPGLLYLHGSGIYTGDDFIADTEKVSNKASHLKGKNVTENAVLWFAYGVDRMGLYRRVAERLLPKIESGEIKISSSEDKQTTQQLQMEKDTLARLVAAGIYNEHREYFEMTTRLGQRHEDARQEEYNTLVERLHDTVNIFAHVDPHHYTETHLRVMHEMGATAAAYFARMYDPEDIDGSYNALQQAYKVLPRALFQKVLYFMPQFKRLLLPDYIFSRNLFLSEWSSDARFSGCMRKILTDLIQAQVIGGSEYARSCLLYTIKIARNHKSIPNGIEFIVQIADDYDPIMDDSFHLPTTASTASTTTT